MLVLVGAPLKYLFDRPELVKFMGPIHGALFLLFIVLLIGVAAEYEWKPGRIAKVFVSRFVPFGTFYIDKTILSKEQSRRLE